MSKDKKKDGAGKRIPKRIAGVKLPKEIRRKGEALIEAAGSPAGREVIAKGLTIAAGFASMAAARNRAPKPDHSGEGATAAPSPEGTAPAAAPLPIDPQKVVEAVSTVAEAVLGRLFPGKPA